MKRISIVTLLLFYTSTLFATHYQQKGSVNEQESRFVVYKESLTKLPNTELKPFYDFYGDCSGLKNQETGLVKTGEAEFVGASGKTHDIAKIFSTYEKRLRVTKGRDFSFTSTHDDDLLVVVNKKGDAFTIDIYTGEDAYAFKAAEAEDK